MIDFDSMACKDNRQGTAYVDRADQHSFEVDLNRSDSETRIDHKININQCHHRLPDTFDELCRSLAMISHSSYIDSERRSPI
jgi:hypothetical protein